MTLWRFFAICLLVIKCVCVCFCVDVTDSEPSEEDLWLLVAKEVCDYHGLGAMLGLKFNQVEMIEKEKRGETTVINMKILTTWMQRETKKPISWRTLIQALGNMDMTKLAHDVIDQLKQRHQSSP